MKTHLALASLAIAANAADAGVYADALAKADKPTIAALRAKPDDVAARCTLGAVYAKKQDLPRASLYLAGCTDAELPDEIRAPVAKAARDVARQLRESELSSIVITTKPEGVALRAELSAFPGDAFTTPATIWVKAGTYELVATDGTRTFKQSVSVGTFSRTAAMIETDAKHTVTTPKDGKADFRDEGALDAHQQGSPPAVKRGSMMSKKYLGIVEGPAGNLEDPLAVREAPRAPRTLWLGLRVGGGMFDDGATDARAGAAIAATTRYTLAPRLLLAGRLDYSRRGGSSVDVVGASAGAGVALGALALFAQVRGDLRFGDVTAARTLGASAAFNVEVALPATPLTAGLRVEQGLTELVPGARDRAFLVEVGIDWR
ncbi:MAG TPA: hypothetical protein VK427_19845 [Kofleriaceae bacterium]|nr:hypothetical protein [Kofleriaceae bacterium]